MARPVVTSVSQATRPTGSCVRMASSIASEIWSAILSGWPSVTDSDVNMWRPSRLMRRVPPLLRASLQTTRSCNNICHPRFRSSTMRRGASRARVEPLVDRAQASVEHVRVDLGAREIGVPQHHLDRAEVGAAIEKAVSYTHLTLPTIYSV